MIRHIVKLIKKQWQKNVWIVLELFIVFALMWYIVDYFSILTISSRTPVAFETDNTYTVDLAHYQPHNPNHVIYEKDSDEPALNYLRIVDQIRNHPDVVKVSLGQWHYPYCTSNRSDNYHRDSLSTQAQILYVTPDYFDIFKVHPAGGGDPTQLGKALENGIIISRSMEQNLFPNSSAIGQLIYKKDSSDVFRVTGVSVTMKDHLYSKERDIIFLPFKEQGMFGKNETYLENYYSISFQASPRLDEKDFAATFKDEMKTRLSIGNFYLTGITPINDIREFQLKAGGIYESLQNRIGFMVFFLFNVFLGIIGTFWLRIEKRKEEIGLRIAVGSSRGDVMKLMITESILLMMIALIPALLVWLNLILAEILPVDVINITWQRCLLTTIFTILPVCLIIILATWYPARKSASIQPAEALHYE